MIINKMESFMLKSLTTKVFVLIILCLQMGNTSSISPDKIELIAEQLLKKDQVVNQKLPEYTVDGEWTYREKVNWLSGFLGGELWNLYEITGDKKFKEKALEHADRLIPFADIDYTHDMGFIFYPTCVRAYNLTNKAKYRKAAQQAAEMLAKRFNKQGEFIRAWGKLGSDKKAGWMIIDTMMNIELLFWAAEVMQKPEYYDIAYKHALTTMDQAVREDGSSYHVIEFNPQNGKVMKKRTHQGYSDESTWARGQAWGIYGFAKAYQRTKDVRFLNTAEKMADYFINSLPKDYVPYWDLDLSGKDVLRDASAGAVAASGLFILADNEKLKRKEQKYNKIAEKITQSLVDNYLFTESNRNKEEGLLLHTIYNYHKDWGIDESFPAGDYYFTEALKKLWKRQQEERFIENTQGRKVYNLNKDWYYLEKNYKKPDKLYLSAEEWQTIDLPHTWNLKDALDQEPGYRRDASWYQKKVYIPQLDNEKSFFLHFEATNISSKVYVNDQLAGGHVGGYLGYEVDITDFVKEGQENEILVRVDNTYDPHIIPSQKSDFFIYGGICRDVYLKVLPEPNIKDVQVSTPEVSKDKAKTEIEVTTRNKLDQINQYAIQTTLINPDGDVVAKKDKKLSSAKGLQDVTLSMPILKNPRLWSPDHPNLYQVKVSVTKEGKIIDSVKDKIGYRWYEFKKNGPFFLNGKRLLLRGTHRHEEYSGFGNALPDSLHRKDMAMIKEMGANFVRLAHYPQDPEVYEACDSLGLLVWDELPWCRGGIGDDEWKQNTKRMLKEMINQNYNHPSIILWSLGNEVYWLPDFPGGGDIEKLRNFMSELNEIAHNLDPYRLTATRKFYEGSDIVDVFSPSIWAGWYSGVYKKYGEALKDAREKYPRFLHAEYGGASHIGRHTENPITGEGLVKEDMWTEEPNMINVKKVSDAGNWSENYIVDLFDWHLKTTEQLDWFTGNAQWAFKDFGTPLRPENSIPFVNQKGLTDMAGNPKDGYYVYKSYWTENPKFCYIESHTWQERSGPADAKKEVCVYSNCKNVELFVNGESRGRKKRDIEKFPASGLQWFTNFVKGENTIIAKGYSKGNVITSDTTKLIYHTSPAESPENIKFAAKRLKNGNYLIKAEVIDEEGRCCLDYDRYIYFSHDGKGKLLQSGGTPTTSTVIEAANGKAAIKFKPVPGEKAVIEARTQNLKGSYHVIK